MDETTGLRDVVAYAGFFLALVSLAFFVVWCWSIHEQQTAYYEYQYDLDAKRVYGPVTTFILSNGVVFFIFRESSISLLLLSLVYIRLASRGRVLGVISLSIAALTGYVGQSKIVPFALFLSGAAYLTWFVVKRRQGRELLLAKISFASNLVLPPGFMMLGTYVRTVPFFSHYFVLEDSLASLFFTVLPLSLCLSVLVVLGGLWDLSCKENKLKTSLLPMFLGLCGLGFFLFYMLLSMSNFGNL